MCLGSLNPPRKTCGDCGDARPPVMTLTIEEDNDWSGDGVQGARVLIGTGLGETKRHFIVTDGPWSGKVFIPMDYAIASM